MSSFANQYIGIALGITCQDWADTGLAKEHDPATAPSEDIDETTTRITALLLIRICAWILPRGMFTDLSTTTICRSMLINDSLWPTEQLNEDVIAELKEYVKTILLGYNDVPYHNFKHCYHVTISTNKLVDMIVHQEYPDKQAPNTYGFRDDPLMQFAMLLSALFHDVDHRGIPNRQLAMENDELAIKYNDQSIAENESLFIGFSELLKPKYTNFRNVVFPEREDYRRLRKACVNLVLTTDIASPERTQLGKSKWKEAFGDPYETVERKAIKKIQQRRRKSNDNNEILIANDAEISASDATALLEELKVTTSKHENENGENENEEDDSSESLSVSSNSSHSEEDGKKKREIRKGRKKNEEENAGGDAGDGAAGETNNLSGKAMKFHRRLSQFGTNSGSASASSSISSPTSNVNNKNARLGFRRTMDLTGESIETYRRVNKRHSSLSGIKVLTGGSSSSSSSSRRGGTTKVAVDDKNGMSPPEVIDELRESVIMEIIIKSADVAHNLQGFDQMSKWSDCLYLEQRRAFVDEEKQCEGAGTDPINGWFHNQIGFLDFYLLPLARKLDDMGVFGDTRGAVFASIVDQNRTRWTTEGMNLTMKIIMKGNTEYPNDN